MEADTQLRLPPSLCVCVRMVRGVVVVELPNSRRPTEARHTSPLRQVKRDGEDEISKPPLQTHTHTHSLHSAHISTEMFKYSSAPFWLGFLVSDMLL